MWHYSTFTLATDYRHYVLARALQGLGYGFFFVPVNVIAYSQLRPDQNNRASSLTNLFRNWGGSFGIAFITTAAERRHEFHQANLSAAIGSTSPAVEPAGRRADELPGPERLHRTGCRARGTGILLSATTASGEPPGVHGLLSRNRLADAGGGSADAAGQTFQGRRQRARSALKVYDEVAMRSRMLCAAGALALSLSAAPAEVKVWQGVLPLPTYEEGPPNPNPPFDQFTTSRFNYPYTLRDSITDRRVNTDWRAIYLENEYLKCSVLPDLGGHLYTCIDKISGQPMFYANPSIKKAQIGYRGAWAAFGIEFNFPVSHNWVSMSPVDFSFTQEPRRQRLGLRRQHRPRVRHAVDRRTAPRAGLDGARRARHALQPQRRAPSLLLVEQRRRAGLGRFATSSTPCTSRPATASPTSTPGPSIPAASI